MENYIYGFIGCGNMGGALAQSVCKTTDAKNVAVCDSDVTKTEKFAALGCSVFDSATDIAANCKYIFLAVKPQGLAALFDSIAPVLKARKDRFILVSMAAGVSVEKIEKYAGVPCPVIRIMPNTPAKVSCGMTVYTANAIADEIDISGFLQGMSASGKLDAISEKMIDAAGALSGCGPAFVCLFAESLADAGVECGLTRSQALLYAEQTLYGTAKMMLESGENPAVLKDAVCSPGGTTIAGVHALENGGFRGTVMNSVVAAFEKTAKLK